MAKAEFLEKKKISIEHPCKDILPAGFGHIDSQTIRHLKRIAAKRGIDCQSLIRMWARERLEVEMRKISV